MIGPTSGLLRLNDKVKLFGIYPTEAEKKCLLSMWNELVSFLPENSNVSINFSKVEDMYHAEALVGFLSICILSRQIDKDLGNLSFKLKNDVIKKINNSNSGNGWEGDLLLAAV